MVLEATQVTKALRFNQVRAKLGWSQTYLAEQSHVNPRVIMRAEAGKRITLLKASAVLDALNAERKRRGESELRFEDLDWNVKGIEDTTRRE